MTQSTPTVTPRKPLVWIIYQGDEGKRLANELQVWAPPYGVELRLTRNHEPGLLWSVLDRVRQDCDECDAAIALITPDNRPASEAGNTWFEIGLWLGSRDPSLLKVLQHASTNRASDVQSAIVRKFSGDQELQTAFADEINFLLKRLFPNSERPQRKRKVQAVFGGKDKNCWLRPASYACHGKLDSEEPCPFREASMEFAAELMRMGRANHERHTIEDALSRLAFLGQELLALPRPNPNRPTERGRTAKEFIYEGEALKRRLEDLFNTFGRSNYPPPQFDSQTRFREFLKQKLICAWELERLEPGSMPFTAIKIRILERGIEDTWRWLERFQEEQFYEALETGEWKAGSRADFVTRIQYLHDVALVLQSMNLYYFGACREALSVCSEAADPRFVHRSFQLAIEKLPHNGAEPRPRIWRQVNP